MWCGVSFFVQLIRYTCAGWWRSDIGVAAVLGLAVVPHGTVPLVDMRDTLVPAPPRWACECVSTPECLCESLCRVCAVLNTVGIPIEYATSPAVS